MRNNIRLVIADVDGTLVPQDKMLTARAIEAVEYRFRQRPLEQWSLLS